MDINKQNRRRGSGMNDKEIRAQIESLHPVSYGWALSCCRFRPEEAEDVLQTVYLKILQGKARYGGRSSFQSWLFAVIRKTAQDLARRQILRRLKLAAWEGWAAARPETPDPAGEAGRGQLQELFQNALAKLPGRQREVLHLVFYQGLSLREAGEVLGLSVGSVRKHYERGKQRLRQILEPIISHEYALESSL